ncbi:hypothetical protein PS3A_35220 [Pseudomonas sp. 3A(2025)]
MAELACSSPDFLLQAARELMAEAGYGAMSMRQLAARVGLQPGSLYHYVASKQDLLVDVLHDIVERRLQAWLSGRFSRDVRGYIGFLLKRQRSYPCEERLLCHEICHVEPALQPWVDQKMQQLHTPLRQIIERGQREGRFTRQDSHSLAEAILALVQAADGMRRRPVPVDEVWIEARVLQMSLALLSIQA